LDWIGLDWIGLDWIGLDWIGLDWIGLFSHIAKTHQQIAKKLRIDESSIQLSLDNAALSV
jgi:hypothetical protein